MNTANIICKILASTDLNLVICEDNLVNDRVRNFDVKLFTGSEQPLGDVLDTLFTALDNDQQAFCRGWWLLSFGAPLNPVYILPALKHYRELSPFGQVVALGDYFIARLRTVDRVMET